MRIPRRGAIALVSLPIAQASFLGYAKVFHYDNRSAFHFPIIVFGGNTDPKALPTDPLPAIGQILYAADYERFSHDFP
jgi:hypothetical protein